MQNVVDVTELSINEIDEISAGFPPALAIAYVGLYLAGVAVGHDIGMNIF